MNTLIPSTGSCQGALANPGTALIFARTCWDDRGYTNKGKRALWPQNAAKSLLSGRFWEPNDLAECQWPTYRLPVSKEAIQKMVDRVSEAIVPRYTAIGGVARTSLVNSMDETSWLLHGDRQWLWVMANPAVAYFQIHMNRSRAAFGQLIGDWTGILVREVMGSISPGQAYGSTAWRI